MIKKASSKTYKVALYEFYPAMFFALLWLGLAALFIKEGINYESAIIVDLSSTAIILLALFLIYLQIISCLNFIRIYKKEKDIILSIQSPTLFEFKGKTYSSKQIIKIYHCHKFLNRIAPLNLNYIKIFTSNNETIFISELIIDPTKFIKALDLDPLTEFKSNKSWPSFK